MISNSESPIYLFASIDEKTGKVKISGIGIYEKHKLIQSIDLKFDKDGNALPFNKTEDGSHSHFWKEFEPGKIGRKSHDETNHHPIDKKYQQLIDHIVEFNKKGITWKKE